MEATADERGLVADVLGSDPGILEPEICVASLGRPRLLVPLATPMALAQLRPDHDRLRDGCERGRQVRVGGTAKVVRMLRLEPSDLKDR